MLATLRKCLVFLSPRERWRWAALIPLAVLSAAFEAGGAAAVFGLIKITGDPAQAAALPVASRIYAMFPWRSARAVVLAFTVLVGSFYVLKNILLSLVGWVQSKASNDSVVALSRQMLQRYLAAPFAFHLARNSAELIRNTTDTAEAVFRLVVVPAVAVLSEGLIVVAIVAVLMITAPVLTLITLAVLSALLLALLAATRRTLAGWGRDEFLLKKTMLQSLQQTLGGLKEVKLRGRERFFYDLFARQAHALAHIRHLHDVLSTASRLLIETVFVCGVLLVVIVVTLRGSTGPEIVPLLGLYAYAGFRIIPSINRILMNLNFIRYAAAAVDKIHADFVACRPGTAAQFEPTGEAEIGFAERLALECVSFGYDNTRAPVLHDVTLAIRAGESIGVVGPTGAGKSTMIDLILGLLEPSRGRVTVDGVDIATALRAWQRKIGYVPQAVYLIDDTLRRNIGFGLTDAEIDPAKVEAAVRMAQLEEVVTSLPYGLETVVGERGVRLSGGERQRVAIARALYHQPELLVFDEATSALDAQTERELTRAIEALHGQKTLLIIAHRLSTVRNCDRLVFLRNGGIAGVGSFEELLEHNADFRDMAAMPNTGGSA